MIVVTAEQMREMDRLTIQKYGVPSLTLMERAGQAVTQAILQNFARNAKQGVLIVAGKGNNGGDGFVVARLLKKKRIPCEVALLARKDELSPDAAHNLRAYLKLKGKVTEISADQLELLGERMSQKGLIVDAILGTGVKNEVRGLFGDAITMINTSGVPVVAVDIPSGLHTDNGTPLGVAVQAEMTVALGFAKLGEVIYPGLELRRCSGSRRYRHCGSRGGGSRAQNRASRSRNDPLAGAAARPGHAQRHLRPLVSRRRLARQNRRGDSCLPRCYAHWRRIGDLGRAALAQ